MEAAVVLDALGRLGRHVLRVKGRKAKGSVLAATAVETQGRGRVLAAKTVEAQGKGSVFATKTEAVS